MGWPEDRYNDELNGSLASGKFLGVDKGRKLDQRKGPKGPGLFH